MKIIFLDVDGVLNTLTTTDMYSGAVGWEMQFVQRLNRILRATGGALVISNCWRIGRSGTQILNLFNREMGIDGPIIGTTPVLNEGERGTEIAAWLDAFERKTGQKVENFLIFDDYEPKSLQDHWIKTEFSSGLRDDLVDEAIQVLKGQVSDSDSESSRSAGRKKALFMSVVLNRHLQVIELDLR